MSVWYVVDDVYSIKLMVSLQPYTNSLNLSLKAIKVENTLLIKLLSVLCTLDSLTLITRHQSHTVKASNL